MGLYYFANVSKIRFYEACGRQWKTLQEAVVSHKQVLGLTPEARFFEEKAAIVEWQHRHCGIFLLIFMPESFLFGLHFRTFGKTLLYYVYNIAFWLGSLFSLLFFTTALPLDKAWRCYPVSSLRETSLGRCDNPKSLAAQQLHIKHMDHTEFFWVCIGVWCLGHAIAVALWLYSSIFYRSLYASHVAKQLQSYVVAVQRASLP